MKSLNFRFNSGLTCRRNFFHILLSKMNYNWRNFSSKTSFDYSDSSKKVLTIVNPMSGLKKGKEIYEEVRKALLKVREFFFLAISNLLIFILKFT